MASFTQIQTRDVVDIKQDAVPSGLYHLLIALVSALVVWIIPYLIPGLAAYQPVTKDTGISVWKFFHTSPSELMVAEANPETSYQPSIAQNEQEVLTLGGNPSAQANSPQDTKPTASMDHEGLGLLSNLSGIQIPKEDYKNIKVPIEDPQGVMQPFYEALARTARQEPGAMTRISHWGDSAVATDKITAVIRVLLQKRFGDGGPGFVLVTPATRWYNNAGVILKHEGWRLLRITHGNARDGRYGLGGVRAIGDSRSFASIATRKSRKIGHAVSRLEVYFLKGPKQGSLALRVDGQATQVISGQSSEWQDAVHRIQVPDGPHRLSIKVRQGQVSVYGVVLERDEPGVVYDNLGLIGYLGERVLQADPAHFKAQISFRQPNLMILMYGGNTLGYPHWRPAAYQEEFTRVIKRFRESRPEASCLVVSPLDHGKRSKGTVHTMPRLKEMIAIQRTIAHAQGCAFYSIFDAMGGEGAIGRWASTHPRLAMPDLAHVTRYGARILGALIYAAIIEGFVKSLQTGQRTPKG